MGQEESKFADNEEDDDDESIPDASTNNNGSPKASAEKKMDGAITNEIPCETHPTKLEFDQSLSYHYTSTKAAALFPIRTKRNSILQCVTADASTPRFSSRQCGQEEVSPHNKRQADDYQELCLMKKARNQARLKELGFGPTSTLGSSKHLDQQQQQDFSTTDRRIHDPTIMPTLMMPAAAADLKSRVFPHRSVQIRQLKSLLLSTQPPVMIPSPIFVTGPKGTGKSSIVQHVIQEVFRSYNGGEHVSSLPSSSPFAYVDCSATIHFPKTAKNDTAILHAIYDQFSPYRTSRAITSPWKLHLELLALDDETSTTTTTFTRSTRLVVLDHADGVTIDTLQQLFCLPEICWIILTRSSLLSLSVPRVSAIHVRFPAYKDRIQVRDILLDDYVRRLVTGTNNLQSSFASEAYMSFVDALTQAISVSDIRTHIRKGRLLWPGYIAPLYPKNIQATISTMGLVSPSKANVINHLDQLMLPHWRREKGKEEPLHFPKLAKYLLLAAFICQSNHHDSDKNLFLIQSNGRRRKNDPVIAPRSSRASFPLERLYSVYVSIVSLNEKQHMAVGDLEFFDRLAYLKDLGILERKGQAWMCTIAAAKAFELAETIHFSLGNYVKRTE